MEENHYSPLHRTVTCVLALFLTLLCSCGTPKAALNRGSCFGAVTGAMRVLRAYLEENGRLPFVDADSAKALQEAGLDGEELNLVHYVNDSKITSASPKRTIILICGRTVTDKTRSDLRYIALLSGHILIVPEANAELGKVLPDGVGETVSYR